MKFYSIEFREKIVKTYFQGKASIRKVAARFSVAKSFVQKLLSIHKCRGSLEPKKPSGAMKGALYGTEVQLQAVERYPDATLLEYCEYWGENHHQWVSESAMCRALQKQKLTLKKTSRSDQWKTERVRNLRIEPWQKVKQIQPENLVFLDEMGVLVGLILTHARSYYGSRVEDFKPFYRGSKVTVIGAISLKKVLAVMTLDGSMNGKAFQVFVEKCLLPQLSEGAVVVMDNVPAHKVKEIEPLIQSVGASVLYQSPPESSL
jgi:Transposase and inactivated derivatives